MEKENINVLDELNKGCCMGYDATRYVLDKIEDKEFFKCVEKQSKHYKELSEKIEEAYPEYSSDKPHETNAMNKVMTWYGIQMKTITDSTTSKLAEILVQGTNMGIIEGRRLLNQKDTDSKVEDFIKEYVDFQEKDVERLKEFL